VARFLGPLRAAFADGDPERMLAEYVRARRRPLSALPLLLVQALYPVQELLQVLPELDRRIARDGLPAASRWLLGTYVRNWRCEVPGPTREALRSGPVLVYGDHLSLLTPFLVAAAVDRPDLRIVSAAYVHHFLPSYTAYSLPVSTPSARLEGWTWSDLRGIVETKLLELVASRELFGQGRERNRAALEAGGRHLREGGCVLIAPAGGPIRRRPWYPGIGHIVAETLRESAPPLRLVPYRELHLSPHRVTVSLRRGPVARFERRVLCRRPAAIRLGQPVPAEVLVPRGAGPEEITQRLEAHYRGLFSAPGRRGRARP